jgi:hypothetical protein
MTFMVEAGRHSKVVYAGRVCLLCNATGDSGGLVDDGFCLLSCSVAILSQPGLMLGLSVCLLFPWSACACLDELSRCYQSCSSCPHCGRCLLAIGLNSVSSTSDAEQPQAEA